MYLNLLLIPFLFLASRTLQDPNQPPPIPLSDVNTAIQAGEWNYARVLFDLELRKIEVHTLTQIRTAILKQFEAHDVDPASVPGFEAWNLEIVRTSAVVMAQTRNTLQFDHRGNPLDKVIISSDPAIELLVDGSEDVFQNLQNQQVTSAQECKALVFEWAPKVKELTEHAIVETGDLVTKLAIDARR